MTILSICDNDCNEYYLKEVSTLYKKVEAIPNDILFVSNNTIITGTLKPMNIELDNGYILIVANNVFIIGSLKPFINIALEKGHICCKGLSIFYKKVPPVSVDMPVLDVSELTNKHLHRYQCLQKLEEVRKIPLVINQDSIFQTVLIEFRPLPHLEYLIRNTIRHLPYWSHTVICGFNNYDMIKAWFPTLSILKLPIYNLEASEYSRLLLQESFWNQFHGRKLLIYQEDTLLFHGNIAPFLKYDYIGAPWPLTQDDNSLGVGNGGFSFRNKECMIECLKQCPIDTFIPSPCTADYMKWTNSTCVPEDAFFTKTMIEKKIGVVAPRDVAMAFSQESINSNNPLGGHQFWIARKPGIILGTNYHEGVTHRGGWRTIIHHLKENDVFTDYGIRLIDCMEQQFMWENKPCHQPWVGIAHYSIHPTPTYYSLETLVELESLKESLPYCRGIIVLSKHNVKLLPPVRTTVIKHPLLQCNRYFSMQHFLICSPSVIQLGSQDRIMDFVENLNTTYPKLLMPGREMESTIPVLFTNSHEEYDEVVCSNIIIIPLITASANNSVLEMISMNIPAFVTRLPSTEEYLGEGYPMFFQTKEDVEVILNDESKLYMLMGKTTDYLKNMDKSDLSLDVFRKKLVDFCT